MAELLTTICVVPAEDSFAVPVEGIRLSASRHHPRRPTASGRALHGPRPGGIQPLRSAPSTEAPESTNSSDEGESEAADDPPSVLFNSEVLVSVTSAVSTMGVGWECSPDTKMPDAAEGLQRQQPVDMPVHERPQHLLPSVDGSLDDSPPLGLSRIDHTRAPPPALSPAPLPPLQNCPWTSSPSPKRTIPPTRRWWCQCCLPDAQDDFDWNECINRSGVTFLMLLAVTAVFAVMVAVMAVIIKTIVYFSTSLRFCDYYLMARIPMFFTMDGALLVWSVLLLPKGVLGTRRCILTYSLAVVVMLAAGFTLAKLPDDAALVYQNRWSVLVDVFFLIKAPIVAWIAAPKPRRPFKSWQPFLMVVLATFLSFCGIMAASFLYGYIRWWIEYDEDVDRIEWLGDRWLGSADQIMWLFVAYIVCLYVVLEAVEMIQRAIYRNVRVNVPLSVYGSNIFMYRTFSLALLRLFILRLPEFSTVAIASLLDSCFDLFWRVVWLCVYKRLRRLARRDGSLSIDDKRKDVFKGKAPLMIQHQNSASSSCSQMSPPPDPLAPTKTIADLPDEPDPPCLQEMQPHQQQRQQQQQQQDTEVIIPEEARCQPQVGSTSSSRQSRGRRKRRSRRWRDKSNKKNGVPRLHHEMVDPPSCGPCRPPTAASRSRSLSSPASCSLFGAIACCSAEVASHPPTPRQIYPIFRPSPPPMQSPCPPDLPRPDVHPGDPFPCEGESPRDEPNDTNTGHEGPGSRVYWEDGWEGEGMASEDYGREGGLDMAILTLGPSISQQPSRDGAAAVNRSESMTTVTGDTLYGRSMDLWRFATSGCRFWRMSSDPRKWERAVDVFVLDVHVGLLSEFAAIVIPGVMQTILGSFTPALFPGLIQLGRTECPPKQALAALLVQLTIEIFTACATLVIYDRGGFPVKWRRCLDQPWKFYGSLCVWVCFIFFWILWASGDIVAQNSTNSMPSWMAGRD